MTSYFYSTLFHSSDSMSPDSMSVVHNKYVTSRSLSEREVTHVADFRFDLRVQHRDTCDGSGTGPDLLVQGELLKKYDKAKKRSVTVSQ